MHRQSILLSLLCWIAVASIGRRAVQCRRSGGEWRPTLPARREWSRIRYRTDQVGWCCPDCGDRLRGIRSGDRPFPLIVKIASDVLFKGELLIKSGRLVSSRSVEIPGGTTREFTIIVDAGLGWGWNNDVQVRLVVGDEVVAEDRVTPVDKRGIDLVGVFPVLAGRDIPDRRLYCSRLARRLSSRWIRRCLMRVGPDWNRWMLWW